MSEIVNRESLMSETPPVSYLESKWSSHQCLYPRPKQFHHFIQWRM